MLCSGCALSTKLPPADYQSWSITDKPLSRLHVDYARPLNGTLIVVVTFSKWSEIFNYKRPTTTINFEIFSS